MSVTHAQELVQTTKVQKYSYIDLLRGIAILGVIAVHSSQHVKYLNIIVIWIFNYGQAGVQLFFVVSAITLCLSSDQRNEKSFIHFYIRRFFRIAPLFYMAIPFYFLWRVCIEYYKIGAVAVPDKYSILGVIETIFFVYGFDPRNFNFIVPGGWSIAVEMSFYTIFPILFFIQSKYKPIKFIIFAASVSAILLLIKYLLIYKIQPIFIEKEYLKKFELEYYLDASIFNQISVFLIGVTCYQCIYSKNKLLAYRNRITPLAIPLIVGSCFLLNSNSYTRTPFVGFIYPVILAVAFSLIAMKLATINDFKGGISKLLIGIGKVSFSMYITHFFILDVVYFFFYKFINHFIQKPEAQLALMYSSVLSLTFFISKLTYKYIEKKGIELGDKLIAKVK